MFQVQFLFSDARECDYYHLADMVVMSLLRAALTFRALTLRHIPQCLVNKSIYETTLSAISTFFLITSTMLSIHKTHAINTLWSKLQVKLPSEKDVIFVSFLEETPSKCTQI